MAIPDNCSPCRMCLDTLGKSITA